MRGLPPVRILLVNDLPPGPGSGAEVYLQRLADGLAAAGDVVELFAGEVTHRGVGKLLDGWDPAARIAVRRRASAVRADVVHHHNVLRDLSVSVLGVPPGVPCMLTVHDQRLLGQPDAPGLRGTLDRRLLAPFARTVARRRVDLTVGVSSVVADRLRRAHFGRVEHVPVPAAAPCRPPRLVGDCVDVAYVGRLTEDKGLRVLSAAFDTIAARHPASRLLVAGTGPLAGWLAGRATLLGRLDAAQVSDLLGSVRVVVVPSLPALRPEGSSLSAVEAAMHGRPVLTSDDPALVELGLGVPVPAGSVPALAAALDRLLADPAEAARIGAAGQAVARARHTVDAVVGRMRELYAGV